jgi:uncharacterized protein (TIGR03000 family)
MHRTVTVAILTVAGVGLLLLTPPASSQANVDTQPAYLRVYVPASADLTVDGTKTQQTGEIRRFMSPPLPAGQKYVYTVKAVWKDAGSAKEIAREETAHVRAGQETTLDLRPQALDQDKQEKKPDTDQDREPDVVYLPTPQDVVDKMLELAKVTKDDVVYDLGCGDGRIVVTAAKKYGCKAVGFDINPERVKDSLENVKKNHVENLVTIKKADIFTLDLTPASVVTLYLLPSLNVKLMPQLEKLKPGSRIVSHDFDMRGAKPKHEEDVTPNGSGERKHKIYLWVVPWDKE